MFSLVFSCPSSLRFAFAVQPRSPYFTRTPVRSRRHATIPCCFILNAFVFFIFAFFALVSIILVSLVIVRHPSPRLWCMHTRHPHVRTLPKAVWLRSCARGSPMPTMLGVPCMHLIVTVVIMDASAQIAIEEWQTTKIQSPLSCIQVKCKKKDCETTSNVEYRHQNRSESFDLSHPFIRCPGTLGSPSVIMLAMSTP